jgi:hypothetical protein
MGHQDHRHLLDAPDPQQFLLETQARQRIERAQRLVEQQDFGLCSSTSWSMCSMAC